MANFTPNYNLRKDAQTEQYNVNVPNGNMDLLDAAVDALADRVVVLEGVRGFLKVGYTPGDTDSNGYKTLTHGAPFTPRAIIVWNTSGASSAGAPAAIDTITATTCRVRFMNWASGTGGLLISDGIGTIAMFSIK